MKTFSLAFLKMLPAMLTLITCAKDKDEQYIDEDQDYVEVQYGKHDAVTKEMAIENWEMFLKQAHTAILLTESNLRSTQSMVDDASGQERQKLRVLYTSCSNRLENLKEELEDRDTQFDKELKRYDSHVQPRNEAFKKQFRRKVFDINLELENAQETN